jgi:molybdopterin molybdotransferase
VISIEQAREIVVSQVHTLALIERIELPSANGCVLREDVAARDFFPAADVSMMDGFAIQLDDKSERLRVVGEVRAGFAAERGIGEGECMRIFTGAPLPPGADAVIPQEDTEVEAEVHDTHATNSQALGTAARFGRPTGSGDRECADAVGWRSNSRRSRRRAIRKPCVTRALSVAHIATGDEIVDAMTEPPPGKIRDT